MKKFLPFLLSFLTVAAFGQTKLIITGAYDGPLPGGNPKGIELFTLDAIDDLSIYGVGSANNGGGTDSVEYTFPAMTVGAGAYLYVALDSAGFNDFFGFNPDFTDGSMAINGDDAVELFMNGNVVDVFGDINMDGSGTAWEHLDGWAYRQNGTGPDGSAFAVGNWTYSGIDVFDGQSTNMTSPTPFPIGTYSLNPNTNLTANNDVMNTQVNTAITLNLLDNDNLPNGYDQFMDGSLPMNGTATYETNGDVTYTPNTDFCGDDEFTYIVCQNMDCDTATVAVNVECPVSYEVKTIGEVTEVDADGLPTADEALVILTGVVHSVNYRPGGLQFALIDSNNDGITVFSNSDPLGYTVTQGDELSIKGEIGSFRGSLQLYADEITNNSAGNTLFDPTPVTALNEASESQLVVLENVRFVDPNDWGTGSFNIDVTDGTNTYSLRIWEHLNIQMPTGNAFNITGIGSQFDFDAPFLEGYQLFPRSSADFSPLSSTDDLEWANSISIAPNPVSNMLNISGADDIDRVTIFNNIGQPMKMINDLSSNHSFSVSYLSEGVYFLRFEKEGQQWVTPFVKQ